MYAYRMYGTLVIVEVEDWAAGSTADVLDLPHFPATENIRLNHP